MPDVNFEQTTPKSSSSLKLALVILGMFALVGVSAYTGYLYGKQQVPPPATTPEVTTPPVTEVPESTPPAKVDETAGWKVYSQPGKTTGESYEIKYPRDWSYAGAVGPGQSSVTFAKGSNIGATGVPNNPQVYVLRSGNLKDNTLDGWLSSRQLTPSTVVTDRTVSGVAAKQIENKETGSKTVYIVYGNYGFQLGVQGDDKEVLRAFDLMLSTFRFVE